MHYAFHEKSIASFNEISSLLQKYGEKNLEFILQQKMLFIVE